MKIYRGRVVDDELRRRLRSAGAVVIEGPKACGKTETARQVVASEVSLDVDQEAKRAAALDPALILKGPTPRLIDEWQAEPAVWNHIRRAVDARGEPGQFILTGSAVPADDVTRHSGAGRIARMRMRPMSLFESGHSTGAVSLRRLLAGGSARSSDPGLKLADLANRVAAGGWPGLVERDVEEALEANSDYLEEIRRVDIGKVGRKRRDPAKLERVLRSLARNSATYVSVSTLAADAGGSEQPIKENTVHEYLSALERLMVVEDQPAWAPHLRSRSRLRSAAKRHFVDPSLAVAALRADPDRLLKDLELLGFLFESLTIRDLRVYAQAAQVQVLQYRDSTGLEIDAILESADGRWAAFQIKLGAGEAEEGAASLRRFAERVDTRKCGPPSALGVIVGMGYGYRRADGVDVVPIGALGP